tara:strand:- start:217 stop:1290 length:1074 start_codon:yes stop_codon:yes gene_type:complete
MKKNFLSPVKEIIKDAKKGKLFLLVDNKDRENEGDLVVPASKCNYKKINFMATHGRGLICLALTNKKVKKLGLPLMSPTNNSRMQTAFTVSIESRKGVTTGISAFDRAKTIKTAIDEKSKKKDLVSPGHVFPLVSRIGGVLERAGHTEASVDISKLANLNPSAVICEVMNQDGRMARLNDLIKFSKKHKIKIGSISDLIAYRIKNEKLINNISSRAIKIGKYNNLILKTFTNKLDNSKSFVLKKGNFNSRSVIPVRVMSIKIKKNFLYENKDVIRNLNFLNKFKNYALILIEDKKSKKEKILEQFSKNNILRYYGYGAQIIKYLGLKKIILISRSFKRIIGLEGFGIKIIKQKIVNV